MNSLDRSNNSVKVNVMKLNHYQKYNNTTVLLKRSLKGKLNFLIITFLKIYISSYRQFVKYECETLPVIQNIVLKKTPGNISCICENSLKA